MTADPPLYLTCAAARALDAAAIDRHHLPGILLMERAALALLDHAKEMLSARSLDTVLILCGPGSNGGDGYALARLLHLHCPSLTVTLAPLAPPHPGTDAETNASSCLALDLPHIPLEPPFLDDPCLIVDALFGTGLNRPLGTSFATLFDALHSTGNPILAVDLPSGLDSDSGQSLGPCIRATRTVTFVAPKPAMANPTAAPFLGRVEVADIGTPPPLLVEFGRPLDP